MKKLLLGLIFAAVCAPLSAASPQNQIGLGVVVGNPFGPTIKYWMSEKNALDFGVGFEDDPVFYADYLWHNWNLTTQPSGARLGFYAGVGPRFQTNDDHEDDEFGMRIPFGVSILLSKAPLELFGEIVPVFEFTPDTDAEIDAGIGVRFLLGG